MRYGAVATGHAATSNTAMEILKDGGNAIDAAIAAYLTACVAEPCMASLAAGAFATVYHDGNLYSLDGFCHTPAIKSEHSNFEPIHVDFGTAQEVYYGGCGAIAIPGVLKALYALHDRFGSLPLSRLFEPAIHLAKEGIPLTPFQHLDLTILKSIFYYHKRGREIFFDEDKLKEIGQKIKMEKFSDFLEVLAIEGERLFYEGEIASSIEDLCLENGGHVRRNDLKTYQVNWNAPSTFQHGRYEIHMPPGPSMGHALYHRWNTRVPDTNQDFEHFSNDHLETLLPALLGCRDLIQNREVLFSLAGVNDQGGTKLNGTSHLNVVDVEGNAIAMTFSIGEGSGIWIDGTDIHLNNMLGEPSLLPNGLNSWIPGRRLASMMSPTLITDMMGLKYALGTGGAERIPVMLSLATHYLLDLNMDLQKAIEAPRVYLSGHQLEVEAGFEEGSVGRLVPTRYWDKTSLYFGGVHGIAFNEGSAQAVGDYRREGSALVE